MNIIRFWIHQDSEYARDWICQGSQYTAQKLKFSNIDFFSKCDQTFNGKLHFLCNDTSGFWVCQSSKYTRVPNILGLHRVLNVHEYFWLIPEYARLYLIMSEYAGICGDMREYTKIYLNGFCFTFPHCSNALSKGIIGCFLEKTKFDFF